MNISINRSEPIELKRQWQLLAEENPRLFPREIAERLGISEAELMASRIGEQAQPHEWITALAALS